MQETKEARLKRLRIRSWRRGTKEMDLILGAWANTQLEHLSEDDLVLYDALLSENDHDLYQWVSGQGDTPERFVKIIDQIAQSFQKTHAS